MSRLEVGAPQKSSRAGTARRSRRRESTSGCPAGGQRRDAGDGRVGRRSRCANSPTGSAYHPPGACSRAAGALLRPEPAAARCRRSKRLQAYSPATESRMYTLNPCACPAAVNPPPETCTDGGAKSAKMVHGICAKRSEGSPDCWGRELYRRGSPAVARAKRERDRLLILALVDRALHHGHAGGTDRGNIARVARPRAAKK